MTMVPFNALTEAFQSLPVLVAAGLLALDLALRIALLGIIPHNRKPSSAMAWLLLVLLIPFVGLAIFLLLGRTQIGRRRHEKQAEVNDLIRRNTSTATGSPHAPGSSYVESVVTLNRNLGALPASQGNEVMLLSDYSESIEAMTAAVDGAQHFVHVQFYITAWDPVTGPFFDALVRATDRGVTVRLLFDYLGSRASRATRTCSRASTRRGLPGGRCSRSGSAKVSCAGPTCATTARSSWWTVGWRSWAPRT